MRHFDSVAPSPYRASQGTRWQVRFFTKNPEGGAAIESAKKYFKTEAEAVACIELAHEILRERTAAEKLAAKTGKKPKPPKPGMRLVDWHMDLWKTVKSATGEEDAKLITAKAAALKVAQRSLLFLGDELMKQGQPAGKDLSGLSQKELLLLMRKEVTAAGLEVVDDAGSPDSKRSSSGS